MRSDSDPQSAGCCGHHAQLTPKAPAKAERVLSGTCCTRTLVQPEASKPPRLERPVFEDVTLGTFLGLQHTPFGDGPTTPRAFRPEHQRPPPTDLLTALQRLLI
jgi:hypothetical protein